MSMSNLSTVNEQLIRQIIHNLAQCPPEKRLSRLYWSIINNSILPSITHYEKRITLTDEDAITHHGGTSKVVSQRYPAADNNTAKALCLLRQHLPYRTAKWLVSNLENLRSDTLYHAINDFKFRCNSSFHALFELAR